jgi:hypothetical protein
VTANDLITRAMKTLGVLASGETPTSDEVDDGLTVLNNMVDTWATQRLTIYTTTRNVFDLSASTQEYTIGTGGTFNIVRPLWISAASIIIDKTASASQKLELALPVGLTVDQWQEVSLKGLESTYPTQFYYDDNWVAGLAKISVWPTPTTGNSQLVLYTPTALTQFADLTTAYTFPPGYEEALRYQLAIRLGPEFGVQVTPDVRLLALQSLGNIKRVNIHTEELSVDAALMSQGGRYDWRTDRYR